MSNYFIKISNPEHMEKSMLETSKEIIHCLQSHQKIALIRDAKKKNIQVLREELKEIELLMKQLKNNLPKESLAEIEQMMPEPPQEEKPEKKTAAKRKIFSETPKRSRKPQQVASKKEGNAGEDEQIKGLEASLQNIERKLKSLQ